MIEAMKQARDFISRLKFADAEPEPEIVMTVLDQAISEAEQECNCSQGQMCHVCDPDAVDSKPWVGLNWDDLPEIYVGDIAFLHGAQWAEAKLKQKNGFAEEKNQ